jgi:hypothetical protein
VTIRPPGDGEPPRSFRVVWTPPGGQTERRRAVRHPVLVGFLVLLALAIVSSLGGRAWWATHIGEMTGRSWGPDFAIGLFIGLLPLIGVLLAAAAGARRRLLRMLVAGAFGFVLTDLLSPSPARVLTHGNAATHAFDAHAPGYLPGVYTGVGIWFVLLLFAVLRARQRWRRRFTPTGGGRAR